MNNIVNEKMKIDSMKHITKKMKLSVMDDPEIFYIPLAQHIGQISKETVKKGDYVKQYEKIGEIQGNVSAAVHSPISGIVEDIIENPVANGNVVKTLKIRNDFKYDSIKLEKKEMEKLDKYTKEEILSAIKDSGIVGEGGAQFPTHVKYNIGNKKVDTFILNGSECEPYLTADYTVMNEWTEEFFDGIKIVEKLLNPKEIVIGIEEENEELFEKFSETAKRKNMTNIKTQILPSAYPQGSELQLIKAVTGKEIRKGTLPIDAGVIVSNVGTVKSVYDAFIEGKPLIERIVTVSGEKTEKRENFLLKIGTPLSHILEKINPEKEAKIIFGGPMMGEEVKDMNVPVIKGTSGILFLSSAINNVERNNCISCGYCVDVCPMGLMPMKFEEMYRKGKYRKLVKLNLDMCIECGACEYSCPSRVPLIKSIKEGKNELRKMREKGEIK